MKLVIASSSTHQLKNQTTQPKSHTNPVKSTLFKHPLPKTQYRTQYRKTLQKSTLPPTSHPHLKPQSKPLSSYINTKSKEKSTFSPITNFLSNLPTNPHTNPTSNFSYLTSENYYFILLTIKHFLLPIIRLNHKKQTQISIKTISMIKSLSKIKNQKLPSKTKI